MASPVSGRALGRPWRHIAGRRCQSRAGASVEAGDVAGTGDMLGEL